MAFDPDAQDMAAAAVAAAKVATTALTAGASILGGTRIDPALVPRLVNALAQCSIGVAPARHLIGMLGDSTMVASALVKANSWPSRVLPLLQAHSAFDENGFFGTNGITAIASTPTFDPRITLGAGIAFGTEPSVGGFGFSMTNACGPLVFTSTKVFDTLDLSLIAGSAGGTVGIQIDGGAVTNVVGPASNYQKTTIPVTLGPHTITITQVSGAQTVQAISCRDTTAPKVMLANCGRSGWTSVSWTTVNGIGPNRSPMNALYLMQPLAVIINLGINDWSFDVPVATFITNMQTLIDKYKADSDVILMVPFPSNLATYATQGLYVQAIRDLANLNNLPLIDFGRLMTSHEVSNPLGRYADDRHPATLGYVLAARFMDSVMRQLVGRSA